jgi:Icc protein
VLPALIDERCHGAAVEVVQSAADEGEADRGEVVDWGTDDSAQALSYLKRFGSVSVLNGHIHQVMQKIEGHVTFHTAMSTAFPQPAPGSAPSPGPMKVEADRLKKVLGIARMSFHDVNHPIALTDVPLEEATWRSTRR